MSDEVKTEDKWYPGKHVWEGTKAVAKAVKDNPGHAAIGALVLFPLGPVGWVIGGGTGAWIGKKNDPAQNQPEKPVDSNGKV